MPVKTTRLSTISRYGLPGAVYDSLRGLAIDNARRAVQNSNVPDLTDNSTGTAAASYAAVPVPSTPFDASSAGGAQRTAFNTALGKIENASRVLINSLNNVRVRVGLPLLSATTGTQAAANTIPAQDKTVASASGTSAVDYLSGRTAMIAAASNIAILITAFNEVLDALGMDRLTTANHPVYSGRALSALTAANASATGASSISKTAADAFFTAMANNFASLAQSWNYNFVQGGLSDLTDSTGGTSGDLQENAVPAAADGAATTSAPKAGFDTELGKIGNAVASMAAQMNSLRAFYGLPVYTDNSGGTASGTLAALSVNLAAVDGSSGTVAVDQVTARARMAAINNAVSSLAQGINDLAPLFGKDVLDDPGVGTASTTLGVIATATATGVSGAGATLLDADVDAFLSANRDNIATLAAKLAELTGAEAPGKPLLFTL